MRYGILASVLASLPMTAFAGGIAISEFGARTSGMGTTGTAIIDDPAAVFYNPASITTQSGLHLQAGISALMPKWSFTPEGSSTETTSLTRTSTPPNFAATYNFGTIGPGQLAAGLGVFAPYGSVFAWPKGWVGQGQVQTLQLQIFEISPVVAYRPHKRVSIGAGLRIIPGSVYLKRAVEFGDQATGKVELGGRGTAFGATVGVTVMPMDQLSIGFNWRSAATLDLKGDSDFNFPAPFTAQGVDRDVTAPVPLPQIFRLGAAYNVIPELKVAADIESEIWTPFHELAITFKDKAGNEETLSDPREAENSWVLHLGGEFKANDALTVRAGYAYDQKTLPERTVNPAPPDSVRHLVTVCASYAFDRYAVHAYFGDAFFVSRETLRAPLAGTYSGGWAGGSMAYLFGIGFTGAFDFGGAPENAGAEGQVESNETQPAAEPAQGSEPPAAAPSEVTP
jgi:long-chain fatty acid transport protein